MRFATYTQHNRRERPLQGVFRIKARSKTYNRALFSLFVIAFIAALMDQRLHMRGPDAMLHAAEKATDEASLSMRVGPFQLANTSSTNRSSFSAIAKDGNGGSETPAEHNLAGEVTIEHQGPSHLPRLLSYNAPGSSLNSTDVVLRRQNYVYEPSQEEMEGWVNDPWEYYSYAYNPILDPTRTPCVPMRSWQTETHPTCNNFHAVDMTGGDDLRHVGSGGWRAVESLRMGRYGQWVRSASKDYYEGSIEAWKEHEHATDKVLEYQEEEEVILKYVHWRHVDFEEELYHYHRMDAIIADRLGPSKTIPIHGHCGVSALYQKASSPDLKTHLRKRHYNVTSEEKLRLSIEVAETLANLHGIDGEDNVTIVHRDFKPQNVLVGNDGKLKVTDFNDATVLFWNTTSNRQCRFAYGRFPPHWAAGFKPHEQALGKKDLTEKIDVFALGGFLFLILTGSPPFAFDELSQHELKEVVINGTMPTLPDLYAGTNDVAVEAIVNAFRKCFQYNPSDRPSARVVVMRLKSAMKRIVARNMPKTVASHVRNVSRKF